MVVRGKGPVDLFERAARALFSILTDRRRVRPRIEKRVQVTARDQEQLMVSWLSELLFIYEVEAMLFRDFRIEDLSHTHISALALGETFDPRRHRIHKEMKAVTYHQIFVGPVNDLWEARVIFDL